jgi:putative flippase GtrA
VRKIVDLVKKYWDIIIYLVFGVLTTVVDFLIYFPCYNLLHIPATVSNVIAAIGAIIFAYLTNKPFVFHSHDWSFKTVGAELIKFVGTRLGSMLIQTGIIFVTVDLLAWDGNLMKIVTAVVVVILNYVGSKLLVFRKRKDEQ